MKNSTVTRVFVGHKVAVCIFGLLLAPGAALQAARASGEVEKAGTATTTTGS